MYEKLLAAITSMQNPASNPAQNALTNEALAGADYFKKGDFSTLPKGMSFDFEMPGQEIDRYKKFKNVGKEGTFALGDTGGMGAAFKTQSGYMDDKFARDASQNYQDNIRGASGNVRNMLMQAAGAKSGNDSQIISALQGLYGSIPKGKSLMDWIGMGVNAASSIAPMFGV